MPLVFKRNTKKYLAEDEKMSDAVWGIIGIALIVVCIVAVIYSKIKQKQYMNKQRETGEDKRAMLDLMSQVMGETYPDYTYMVGYFTKTTQHGRTTTYYYFPYILAFTSAQMIVNSFIKKEGKLYVRNQLPIDWSATKFSYSDKKKSVTMKFTIAGDLLTVNTNPVIVSGGAEKSDRPLCVYQEQEFEKLKSYLPQYKEYSKK